MSSWNFESKNTASYSYTNRSRKYFLLSEDLFKILKEDGGGILLEQGMSDYSNQSKNTASYSYETKN
jgi:hypothetical protein